MRSLFPVILGVVVAALALPGHAGPQVPVLTLGAKAVSTGYELDGVVEAVRQATVSAQATGRVSSLLVKVGDKVKAGQVLAATTAPPPVRRMNVRRFMKTSCVLMDTIFSTKKE